MRFKGREGEGLAGGRKGRWEDCREEHCGVVKRFSRKLVRFPTFPHCASLCFSNGLNFFLDILPPLPNCQHKSYPHSKPIFFIMLLSAPCLLLTAAFTTIVFAVEDFDLSIRNPLDSRSVVTTGGWSLGTNLSNSLNCPYGIPQCGAKWCCPPSLTCVIGVSQSEACCPGSKFFPG